MAYHVKKLPRLPGGKTHWAVRKPGESYAVQISRINGTLTEPMVFLRWDGRIGVYERADGSEFRCVIPTNAMPAIG